MLEHWSDYLSISWNYFFGTIGVVLNFILIFFVFKHTPDAMRVYATVIRIGAVCDVVISFCAIMVSARVYSSGSSLILMFHGAAKFLPVSRNTIPYVCFLLFCFEVHGYIFSVFVILFSLYYRQRAVTNYQNPLTQKKVNFISYGFSIIAILFTIFAATKESPSIDEIDEFVSKVRPELIGSGWIYYVLLEVEGLSEALVVVMNWVVLIFGIICSIRVHKKLSTLTMSPSSKELQKSLMKILLIQITTPIVQIFALIIHYISTIRNDLQTPLIENTTELLPILLSLITPVITIYYIEPYRRAIKKYCGVNDVLQINSVLQSSTEQF